MRVAIVAMGASKSSYIGEAGNAGTPYGAWDEVWTLNGLVGVLKADRFFMMDDFEIQEKRAEWHPYVKGMLYTAKRHDTPIYTNRVVEGYPNLVEYPLAKVAAKLNLKSLYFTNSVPYMVALAIAEGATKIGIFGCDYTYADNRTEKGRACLEWWCGFAEAKGVEIYVPPTTSLLEGNKSEPYGYWLHDVKLSNGSITVAPKEKPPTAAEVEKFMSHNTSK